MTAELPSPPRGLPTALVAFLRGVERRAAVLAELQTGDAARGDAAVAAAIRRFMAEAGQVALSDWPPRFWSAVLSQPALAQRTPVAMALDPGDALGVLDPSLRAALLLRLVAGLDEAPAAVALGASLEGYRRALQQALPRDADGEPDPRAWERLYIHLQARVDALPVERIHRIREAAFNSAPAPAGSAGAVGGRPPSVRGRRGLLAVLWLLLALCALALAATYWPPTRDALLERLGLPTESGGVRAQPLPPSGPPRVRLEGDAAVIAHPRFRAAAGETPAPPDDLAFDSWLAGQEDTGRPPPRPLVPPAAEDAGRAVTGAVPGDVLPDPVDETEAGAADAL